MTDQGKSYSLPINILKAYELSNYVIEKFKEFSGADDQESRELFCDTSREVFQNLFNVVQQMRPRFAEALLIQMTKKQEVSSEDLMRADTLYKHAREVGKDHKVFEIIQTMSNICKGFLKFRTDSLFPYLDPRFIVTQMVKDAELLKPSIAKKV